MISGSAHISAGETLTALFGAADEDTSRVVLEWRAPRVAFTLLGGAALAVAGAVFQSQTRNPLGSPDIIGFSTGAYTGALLVASMVLTGVWSMPLGAVAGGLGTGPRSICSPGSAAFRGCASSLWASVSACSSVP